MAENKLCPGCKAKPEIKAQKEHKTVIVFCPKCGHMAMGDDTQSAVFHWNVYVSFVGAAQ